MRRSNGGRRRNRRRRRRKRKKTRYVSLIFLFVHNNRIARTQVPPTLSSAAIRRVFERCSKEVSEKKEFRDKDLVFIPGDEHTKQGLDIVFKYSKKKGQADPDEHATADFKFTRRSGTLLAMSAQSRGSTSPFEDGTRLSHGACPSYDTHNPTEDISCVLVFGIKSPCAMDAEKQFCSIVNVKALEEEIQRICDTVQEKWNHLDTLRDVCSNKSPGYFPISFATGGVKEGNVRLLFSNHFPTSSVLEAVNSKLSDEQKIQSMAELTDEYEVYAPNLFALIQKSHDKKRVRIHLYTKNARMNMHFDGSKGKVDEYIKFSYLLSGVGFRDSH